MQECDKEFLKKAKEALQQEPKTGHWIETAEEYYKAINEKGGGVNENTPYFTDDIACSECLAKFSVIDNETERFKCCPNCGAKMSEIPTGSEARARWICCPMCDKKKCEREADDCDVKIYLRDKAEGGE